MAERRYLLILEDSSDRIAGFHQAIREELPVAKLLIADTVAQFKELAQAHLTQTFAISLDHDLHPPGVLDAGDGMQIAQWLSVAQPSCPVIIHTSNGEQGRRMQGALEAARIEVRLAGAIGPDWIKQDWIIEVVKAFECVES